MPAKKPEPPAGDRFRMQDIAQLAKVWLTCQPLHTKERNGMHAAAGARGNTAWNCGHVGMTTMAMWAGGEPNGIMCRRRPIWGLYI